MPEIEVELWADAFPPEYKEVVTLYDGLRACFQAPSRIRPGLRGKEGPMTTHRERAAHAATKEARSMFVNGSGADAEVLVLVDAGGRDLGGWGESVIRDRLIDFALRFAAAEKERFAEYFDANPEQRQFASKHLRESDQGAEREEAAGQ